MCESNRVVGSTNSFLDDPEQDASCGPHRGSDNTLRESEPFETTSGQELSLGEFSWKLQCTSQIVCQAVQLFDTVTMGLQGLMPTSLCLKTWVAEAAGVG